MVAFVFFSLGCVYLCSHLPWTFDGWVSILDFYLQGFTSFFGGSPQATSNCFQPLSCTARFHRHWFHSHAKKANLVQLKVRGVGHLHLYHGNFRPTHMKHILPFSPRPMTQIVDVSPLHWQTMMAKISIPPLPIGASLPLLLQFLCPARNPPLQPSNLSLPFHPFSSFFFKIIYLFIYFFNFFKTLFINKKNFKIKIFF